MDNNKQIEELAKSLKENAEAQDRKGIEDIVNFDSDLSNVNLQIKGKHLQALDYTIDYYKQNTDLKIHFKKVFFNSVMLFMGLVILGSMAVFVLLAIFGTSWHGIYIAAGALASFLSTIIVLPRIIAQHLFPKNEEENTTKLVAKSIDSMK